MIIETIAVAYLVLLSIFDIHYKGKDFGLIPTALTTFFIILMIYLNGFSSLFGLSIFTLFGIMLYELKFYEGGQDIKVMAGLGCLVSTVSQTLLLITFIMIIGVIYKVIVHVFSQGRVKRIPFVPVFATALIIYLLLEVLV